MKKKNQKSTKEEKGKINQPTSKTDSLEDEFHLYADTNRKTIREDGMVEMGKILGIDIYSDLFITFFFYKCKAKTMDEITFEQFKGGMELLGVKTMADLKKKMPNLRAIMQPGNNDFNAFYSFLFTFNMDKKSKKISFEATELYFKSLFGKYSALVNLFLNYLIKTKQEGLNNDQWNCFKDFIQVFGNKFPKEYCINDSWPTLFDDFYIDYCKQHNIPLPELEMIE